MATPIAAALLAEVHRAGALLRTCILPRTCPACAGPDPWCPSCRPAAGGLLVHRGPTGPVRAAMAYDRRGAAVVRAWKLGGRRDLTPVLGRLLGAALGADLGHRAGPVLLVPVPVRGPSRRRRGEDLVAALAHHAAASLPRGQVVPALRWRRAVAEQVGRSPAGRDRNVAGALCAGRTGPGTVVVLDDVLTTGATLGEAVRALAEAGAGPVRPAALAAVVPAARAERPSGRGDADGAAAAAGRRV
jgi:predicted amidophosphoribosyltransferase